MILLLTNAIEIGLSSDEELAIRYRNRRIDSLTQAVDRDHF